MDKVKEALLLKNGPEAFSNEDNTLKNLGMLQEAEEAFKEKALSMGVELHVTGEFDLASQMYDAVIKFDPNHADANHNMGLLKFDTGHDLEALPYLQTALQADTSVAQFWLSYIKVLIQLDRREEAARILSLAQESGAEGEEFLELHQQLAETTVQVKTVQSEVDTLSQPKPNILDTLKLDKALRLAKNNVKEGSHEEAKLIYQDILKKFPKNKKAQQGLAALNKPPQETIDQLINLYNQGKLPAAVDHAKALTQQYPEAFTVWNILGAANAGLGQFDAAVESYRQAIIFKPDYADAYKNMGNVLQDQGKLEEAIEAYYTVLSLKPDYAEAYYNMGNALKYQGKLDEAIASYEKALSLKPDHADAYNNMGNVLRDLGKLEEAIASYNKALSLKPDYAEAHRNLSSLIKYMPEDLQIGTVNELLGRSDLKNEERCHLLYTFAKINEDLGDFDAAFENYVAVGKLRKKLLSYDLEQDERMFDQIKTTAPKLEKLFFNKPIEAATNTPIFILGMPRSGTTLVEQIISCHSQVQGAGELSFLNRFGGNLSCGLEDISSGTLFKVRNSYLTELDKVSENKPFVTDKMPHNFLSIALILKALPEAKIIHVKRAPAATCWSNFKQYFPAKGLGYSYDLDDTVGYYKLYHELMAFWDKHYSTQIYHLDYDRLTLEQEIETRKLIEHLELGWEEACLSPHENKRSVGTASQQQVREKVYTGSSQAWRKFEPYLNGAFDELLT